MNTTKTKVFFTAGTRGGTGKSTVAINLAEYLQAKGLKLLLIDADNTSRTLRGFFPGAATMPTGKESSLDFILDCATSGKYDAIICDMKAGTDEELAEYAKQIPFDALTELGVKMVGFGCVTSNSNSVESFARFIEMFGNQTDYILVKNLVSGDTFHALKSSSSGDVIKGVSPRVMTMQALRLDLMEALETEKITITAAVAGKSKTPLLQGFMAKNHIGNWQKALNTEFDRIAVIE